MYNIMTSILLTVYVICLIVLICCMNNTVYCFIFQYKEWKIWKKMIAMADEFELEFNVNNNYHFVEPSKTFIVSVWDGERASIHLLSNSNCICSTFDTYHSKKLAKLLMNKIA